jgi:16S rRNA processing protein RimM
MDKTSLFTIGKVTGVHGLNGTLKVWSFANSIETYSSGRKVLLQTGKDKSKPFIILKTLPHKKGILLSLEGIDSRTLAENIVGSLILVDRDQLPDPEEDTWYWQDLIGLDVVDNDKGFIGKVKEIFPTGGHDILVVMNNKKETLIPMHKHFIKSVEAKQNTIKVSLPEDLIG